MAVFMLWVPRRRQRSAGEAAALGDGGRRVAHVRVRTQPEATGRFPGDVALFLELERKKVSP